MNKQIKYSIIGALILGFYFFFVHHLIVNSQENSHHPSKENHTESNDTRPDNMNTDFVGSLTEIKKKTIQIIDSIPYCTLITIDSIGQPRARIMSPFPVDSTFVLWFGTHSQSRKVKQLLINPKVTVNYFSSSTMEYISIHGMAEIETNDSIKDIYWKEGWENYYKNKNEDYSVIKVSPIWIEVFSHEKGLISDSLTLKPISFTLSE